MKRFVPDINVILRHPEFVFFDRKEIHLVLLKELLDAVQSTLEKNPKAFKNFSTLVEVSVKNDSEIISVQQFAGFPDIYKIVSVPQLTKIKQNLLYLCVYLKEKFPLDEVILLTKDDELLAAAKDIKIETGDVVELIQTQRLDKTPEKLKIVQKIKFLDWANYAGIIITVIVNGTAFWKDEALKNAVSHIASSLNAYYQSHLALFWTVFAPLMGLALFFIRSKWLFIYALIEISVGLGIARFTAIDMKPEQAYDTYTILKLMSAIYVIVRGLDNLGRHIRRTPLAPKWNSWFGEG